jgi:hypothetical protein
MRQDATTRRRRRALFAIVVAAMALLPLVVARPLGATIEEQRARLPPPAACPDLVEGIWMGQKYAERYGEWYVYTLRVRRAAPGSEELTGDIVTHYWTGGPDDTRPPACTPDRIDRSVLQPARGRMANGRVAFGGMSWTPAEAPCGGPAPPGTYNTDHFTGQIDTGIQEFQSVNNDGGRAVNDPTVFRRIRCLAAQDGPRVTVAAPPFLPPRRRAGCAREW